MTADLWIICHVDVADVFSGRRSPRWVRPFVERVMDHPEAETRARRYGGDAWRQWTGWTPTAEKVAELTDWFIAANTDPKMHDRPSSWRPKLRETAQEPVDLDDAFARIMSM